VSTVPADVPSVRHSSRPVPVAEAANTTRRPDPPERVGVRGDGADRDVGEQLVPAVVPSVT
jgi:hypothetical protein